MAGVNEHNSPCRELAVQIERANNLEDWQRRANGDVRYIRGRVDALMQAMFLVALSTIASLALAIVNLLSK